MLDLSHRRVHCLRRKIHRISFAGTYAVNQLKFTRSEALSALLWGAAAMALSIPMFGLIADRVGARRLYYFGGTLLAVMAVPLFKAIGSGSYSVYVAATILALALNYAIVFARQSNLYAAQFPAELRYSGMSMGVQFASALGGGLAPIVAATLVAKSASIVQAGCMWPCWARSPRLRPT